MIKISWLDGTYIIINVIIINESPAPIYAQIQIFSMNKIRLILFCCLACCINICVAQTTSYYKLTRQIVDGQSSTNVSGGQFITFNKDKCYESDKDGFTVDK